jgi:cobaltochelatase CobN
MRHGYKGAFEIAATVDYMFAFAATTGCVADHHFDAVFDAFVVDDQVRGFMLDANPDAAREMAERLLEAVDRGLWRPRANDAHLRLAALTPALSREAGEGAQRRDRAKNLPLPLAGEGWGEGVR